MFSLRRTIERLMAADKLMASAHAAFATQLVAIDPTMNTLMDRLRAEPPWLQPGFREAVTVDLAGSALTGTPPSGSDFLDDAAVYDFLLPVVRRQQEIALGPYRVIGVLGSGGTGIVLKAEDSRLDRPVAIKLLKPALVSNMVCVRRLLREARAAAALSHDNIMPVYEVGTHRGVPYLVMPLLAGETLEKRLREKARLPLVEVLRIGREIASGLSAAHERGLIHRDIKPNNLWLEAESGRIRILDFGLARFEDDDSLLTHPGWTIGTPAYMAPEQSRGEAVGPAADLFSLGCILYRASTGVAPFPGTTARSIARALEVHRPHSPRKLNRQIPVVFSDLLLELLAKDPSCRPSSAQDVVRKIEAIEQELGRAATPPAPQRRRFVRRVVVALVAVGLVIACLAGAPVVYRLATSQGDLVIETNDPDVEVVIKDGTGKVIDRTGKREILLKAGDYQIDCLIVSGDSEQRFLTRRLRIRRGDRVVVDARLEPGKLSQDAADKVLRSLEARAANPHPNSEALWRDVLSFRRSHPGTNAALRASELLGWLPSPLDSLSPETIPPYERTIVAKKPVAGLVAVLGSSRMNHWHEVQDLAFSPDSNILASASSDSTIKLWQATTGTELFTLAGHHGYVLCVVFSPDGRTIASGGDDGTIRLWDRSTGVELIRFGKVRTSAKATSVAFHPKGQLLASGHGDGMVRFWNIVSGKLVRKWAIGSGEVTALTFLSSGDLAVSAGTDHTVKLFDSETAKQRRALSGHDGALQAIASTSDGRMLASGSLDGTIRLWDPATGETKRLLKAERDIQRLAFSSDGRWLVSSSWSAEQIVVWDIASGSKRYSLAAAHGCRAVAISPNGKLLAGGGFDRAVWMWDAETGRPRPSPGHRGRLGSVAFSGDGQTLATAGWDETIRLWDSSSGKETRVLPDLGRMVAWVEFSPDGQQLAASTWSGRIRLWNRAGGYQPRDLSGHSDYVMCLAYQPGGALLASASRDGSVKVWDLGSGLERCTLPGEQGAIRSVAFSPDGKILAYGSDSGIILREAIHFDEVGRIREHPGPILSLAFSPDGATLASAGADGKVRLWDVASRSALRTLTGHSNWVTSVAFRDDGRLLASSADDGTVRLWNPSLGTPGAVLRLSYSCSGINRVVFSPSGRYIATANGNGTTYIIRLSGLPGVPGGN